MTTYQPDFNDQGHRPDQREGAYKAAFFCLIGWVIVMVLIVIFA